MSHSLQKSFFFFTEATSLAELSSIFTSRQLQSSDADDGKCVVRYGGDGFMCEEEELDWVSCVVYDDGDVDRFSAFSYRVDGTGYSGDWSELSLDNNP